MNANTPRAKAGQGKDGAGDAFDRHHHSPFRPHIEVHEVLVVPVADAPEPALTGQLDECLMPLFRHTDIKGEGQMLRMRDPAHFLVVPGSSGDRS